MMFPMSFGGGSAMGAGLGAAQWEKKPEPVSRSGLHIFFHEAMACEWSIRIPDEEHGGHSLEYAQQAAEEAWQEVSRLEEELSRFRSTSDIAQVNARAGSGEWTVIGASAWECLSWALDVARETEGAFDIALGQVLEERRQHDSTFHDGSFVDAAESDARLEGEWPGPLLRFLELDEDSLRARLTHEWARLDLGAIGKGYALDCAAALLREWSIQDALLHAGQSSVVALGDEPRPQVLADTSQPSAGGWRVELRAPWASPAAGESVEALQKAESVGTIFLKEEALGGSGRRVQGYHIVDPRTGRGARAWQATWVACPGFAALADALSTAFMVLSADEIRAFCRERPQISVLAWREDEALALGARFEGIAWRPANEPDPERPQAP
jgi:thiamine biosynthesis lipoprotein